MRHAARPRGARRGDGRVTRAHGFTMIELLIAIGLFALMSGVLFGALRLAGRSTDAGEAKAEAVSGMRLTSDYLRRELTAQHPQRMRRMQAFPLLFGGTRDEVRFAGPLPARVGAGGMWYYRVSLAPVGEGQRRALVVDRMIPDLGALAMPQFGEAERSVLVDDIASLEISYYGRERGSSPDVVPTWRGSWDDPQLLPILIRIDVVPRTGAAWPPILIAPRAAPEAGCRSWDTARAVCVGA